MTISLTCEIMEFNEAMSISSGYINYRDRDRNRDRDKSVIIGIVRGHILVEGSHNVYLSLA